MGLFLDMLKSEAFFAGVCGGTLLGLAHAFRSVRVAAADKVETMGAIYGGTLVCTLVFAIVGGVVAYFLARDAWTGAFFSGLTALGLVALFLGSVVAPTRPTKVGQDLGEGGASAAGSETGEVA